MYRGIGEAIKLLFWLACAALPCSLILNIVLAVLLWWRR